MDKVTNNKNPYKLFLSGYSAHNYFLNNVGKNKLVLDVGCNDGYIGKLADKSNTFYGLDYSAKSVFKAKKMYKGVLVYDLNKLKKLPWKIKFDLILFGDVLEHVLFPEQVLKYFVSNYLKKDETVIISVPNVANWRIRIQLLLGKFNYTEYGILDKTHLHLYTFKSAEKLVATANLRIISSHGTTKTFGTIIKIFPILQGLFAINIILKCKKI